MYSLWTRNAFETDKLSQRPLAPRARSRTGAHEGHAPLGAPAPPRWCGARGAASRRVSCGGTAVACATFRGRPPGQSRGQSPEEPRKGFLSSKSQGVEGRVRDALVLVLLPCGAQCVTIRCRHVSARWFQSCETFARLESAHVREVIAHKARDACPENG